MKNIVCDIYFEGKRPCFGGVLALEGATGKELWRVYAQHEVYGLNCQYDLDTDGVKDCLAAGRAGVRGNKVQNSSLVLEIPDLMIDPLKKVIIAWVKKLSFFSILVRFFFFFFFFLGGGRGWDGGVVGESSVTVC